MVQRQIVLRARLVLPITRPPIANGVVRVAGNRIVAVGPWRDAAAAGGDQIVDLGETVLLPGLVNAHCHLDYTRMAGELPPPKNFTDWIKLITAAKAGWSYSDYAESWLAGARMLLETGTTTVADIEAVPELLPEVWEATPLRVFSFLEMTGIRARRAPEAVLREALGKIASLPSDRCRTALSPHAPYSTLPELLQRTAALTARRRWPVTTHVAESRQEYDMIRHRRGEMFRWLRRNDRDMSDCGLGTPVQQLHRNGLLGPNLLAVHANCLGRGDAELLARHKVSVVHCPRSHAYFRHPRFPLRRLLRAGVNVCLGTDSLATVRKLPRERIQLSMFDEMQELADRTSWLSPKGILEMATVNAARALGCARRLGELSKGAYADLIAIPFTGSPAKVCEAVVQHCGLVRVSMIDGRWAIAPDSR